MEKAYFIFLINFIFCNFINAQKTSLAISKPITDEYFGIKIIDEYRNLEDLKDQNTIGWMRSQTDYSNSILNTIPNRNYYFEKRLELDKRQGYSISDLKIISNDKYFYLKRSAGEKTAKVYYRQGFEGKEELLYDPVNFNNKLEGKHNYIKAV